MNTRQWVFLAGTLIFGLILGTLWSPRAKDPTPEQIAEAVARFNTRSNSNASSSSNPSHSSASRSQSGNRKQVSLTQELTVGNLISTFRELEDEDQINPMVLARYGAQLTNMGEFEVTALLKQLQGPFDEEDGDMGKVTEAISFIVFSRLCELNGPEAMRMLHSGELGEDIDRDIAAVGMNAWVAADPEGARRWFEGAMQEADQVVLSGGDEEDIQGAARLVAGTGIASAYMRGMTALNPDAVKENISSFQSPEIREHLQMELAEQLMNRVKSKEEILNLLNDDTFKDFDDAQFELVEKLAEVDTGSAEDWASNQPLSPNRDDMYASIANTLLQENPAEGAAWYQAQELSPETTEAERLRLITNRWMVRDLEGAATWLLEQPNNAERDNSESIIALRSAAKGDWEAAFRWSSDISNPETQRQSIDRIFNNSWDRRNNVLAPEAIQAAREAGFGQAVDDYIEARTPATGSRLSGGRLQGR